MDEALNVIRDAHLLDVSPGLNSFLDLANALSRSGREADIQSMIVDMICKHDGSLKVWSIAMSIWQYVGKERLAGEVLFDMFRCGKDPNIFNFQALLGLQRVSLKEKSQILFRLNELNASGQLRTLPMLTAAVCCVGEMNCTDHALTYFNDNISHVIEDYQKTDNNREVKGIKHFGEGSISVETCGDEASSTPKIFSFKDIRDQAHADLWLHLLVELRTICRYPSSNPHFFFERLESIFDTDMVKMVKYRCELLKRIQYHGFDTKEIERINRVVDFVLKPPAPYESVRPSIFCVNSAMRHYVNDNDSWNIIQYLFRGIVVIFVNNLLILKLANFTLYIYIAFTQARSLLPNLKSVEILLDSMTSSGNFANIIKLGHQVASAMVDHSADTATIDPIIILLHKTSSTKNLPTLDNLAIGRLLRASYKHAADMADELRGSGDYYAEDSLSQSDSKMYSFALESSFLIFRAQKKLGVVLLHEYTEKLLQHHLWSMRKSLKFHLEVSVESIQETGKRRDKFLDIKNIIQACVEMASAIMGGDRPFTYSLIRDFIDILSLQDSRARALDGDAASSTQNTIAPVVEVPNKNNPDYLHLLKLVLKLFSVLLIIYRYLCVEWLSRFV